MVTKTQEELSEMTKAEIKEHLSEEERVVFGQDFRRDRHGRPVERGIGAPGNESENHFRSIERYEGKEAADRARAEAAKHRAAGG